MKLTHKNKKLEESHLFSRVLLLYNLNMDIERLPNDQKLQLCRWYFKGRIRIHIKIIVFIILTLENKQTQYCLEYVVLHAHIAPQPY